MTTETRLGLLPSEARKKLGHELYEDDLNAITETPTGASWEDLFDVTRVQSFVIWHSWRIHVAADAKILKKAPSKPSMQGWHVVSTMINIATAVKRPDEDTRSPEEKALRSYKRGLSVPKPIHNKQADYHRFEFTEIENIAFILIEEARRMFAYRRYHHKRHQHPSATAAARFRVGLMLMLAWRVPMRARNWCECLLYTNLVQENGTWRFHFEGDELKIGERHGDTNVFDMAIPSEVVPYMEEWLRDWRHYCADADIHRYVFPTVRAPGGPMTVKGLYQSLREHVYRFGGKRFYTHLIRTLFYSHAIKDRIPSAVAAYFMGDTVGTANRYYLEADGPAYEDIMAEARKRQLNGHGNGHGHPSARG
jgi:hypothetical protein